MIVERSWKPSESIESTVATIQTCHNTSRCINTNQKWNVVTKCNQSVCFCLLHLLIDDFSHAKFKLICISALMQGTLRAKVVVVVGATDPIDDLSFKFPTKQRWARIHRHDCYKLLLKIVTTTFLLNKSKRHTIYHIKSK